MEKETARRLLELLKMAQVSIREGGTDLVFELRDVIRKAESEERQDGIHEIRQPADELH